MNSKTLSDIQNEYIVTSDKEVLDVASGSTGKNYDALLDWIKTRVSK